MNILKKNKNAPFVQIFFIFLMMCIPISNSLSAELSKEQQAFSVAIIERPPFVMKQGTGYIGYSIELWDAIAKELNLEYEVKVFDSFPEMLSSVKDKQSDVAISNITITSEREELIDFSHPIYLSGLQIMLSRSAPSGLIDSSKAVLNSGILWVIGGSFLILLVVANLIWLFERGQPGFNSRYVKGIWDSLWWSIVTVTTVGYGDQVPRTLKGRVLSIMWMIFSLFLLSIFVAQISSSIVNSTFDSEIQGPDDLRGKTVATIDQSTAHKFLESNLGAKTVTFKSPVEMIRALEKDKADAVVFDAPVLTYYEAHRGNPNIKLVGPVFKPEQLGIALQENSQHRDPINQALLRLSESGETQKIYDLWFSKEN